VRTLRVDLADTDLPALPGGYPNLLTADEPERVEHAYGPNAARLRTRVRQAGSGAAEQPNAGSLSRDRIV
jgi:hypothetical protein